MIDRFIKILPVFPVQFWFKIKVTGDFYVLEVNIYKNIVNLCMMKSKIKKFLFLKQSENEPFSPLYLKSKNMLNLGAKWLILWNMKLRQRMQKRIT